MRYFSTIMLLGGAAGVAWYNATHATSKLLFPFLSLLPGLGDDPVVLGQATVALLAGIGVLSGVWSWWHDRRVRRRHEGEA